MNIRNHVNSVTHLILHTIAKCRGRHNIWGMEYSKGHPLKDTYLSGRFLWETKHIFVLKYPLFERYVRFMRMLLFKYS